MSEWQGPFSLTESDQAELVALLNLCFRPSGGDMLHDYPRHLSLCNRENVRFIRLDGRIVSHVATSIRPVLLGGIPTVVAGIGAVATHPDARGLRLASVLMEDAVARSLAQGADLMLISGDLGIYRRMNARVCGGFPKVVIPKSSLSTSGNLHVRPVTSADLDAVIRLRQSQVTRYLLPREDIEALFECKIVMDKRSDWWLVWVADCPVGFGAVHHHDDEIVLLDWAGCAEALPEAAPFWLEHYAAQHFHYAAVCRSLIPLAWSKFILPDPEPFYGTLLFINAKRFLQRAEAYFCERIGESNWKNLHVEAEDQKVCFTLGDESIELANGGEIADLFFGVPGRDFISEHLPHHGPLAQLLANAFPIPLVWYGLGYV